LKSIALKFTQITVILALTSPAISFAGSVYKCSVNGVTKFSQTPCGGAAHKVKIHHSTGTPEKGASLEQIKLDCLSVIKSKGDFKDPASVKIESVRRDFVTDKSGIRQVLGMFVNAKNSYGGYTGAKPYFCFLNHNGTQLSKIQYLIKD